MNFSLLGQTNLQIRFSELLLMTSGLIVFISSVPRSIPDPRSGQALHVKTDGGPSYFQNAFFTRRAACVLDLASEIARFLHIS